MTLGLFNRWQRLTSLEYLVSACLDLCHLEICLLVSGFISLFLICWFYSSVYTRPKQSINLVEKTNWEIIWSNTQRIPMWFFWKNAVFHFYCNACVLVVAYMYTQALSVMNVFKIYLHLSLFGTMLVFSK